MKPAAHGARVAVKIGNAWHAGRARGFACYVEANEPWYKVELDDGRKFFAQPRLARRLTQ